MTQAEALAILKSAANVYLTGSAGSGKTHVLNEYVAWLKAHEVPAAVTASTGIAATHMGGQTIHSWSGLGIRDSLSERDMDALEQKRHLWDRYQKVRVLVIDEISMLDASRLDMVDSLCRSFKRSSEPFGGLQVVMSGDFFQLPPIGQAVRFAYESAAWKELNPKVCYLEEQHRQDDGAYASILNAIRNGEADDGVAYALQDCQDTSFDLPPTKLYTHNVDVDRLNEEELSRIADPDEHVYGMVSKGRPSAVEALRKSCLAPSELRLKRGAMVMFVKNNFEAGYVNGTLGEVVSFGPDGYPVVETLKGEKLPAPPAEWSMEEDGKVLAAISQVPLRLAWAITIHKSQGMSLDAAEIDLSRSFVKGQGYVALSRVRSLSGLRLVGMNPTALQVDGRVAVFDADLREKSKEARALFAKLTPQELAFLHDSFVRRSGGILDGEEREPELSTYDKTRQLAEKKMRVADMAEKRGMTEGTIISHLEKLAGDGLDLEYLRPDKERLEKIRKAFGPDMKLSPARRKLGKEYSFEELRLARLFLKE